MKRIVAQARKELKQLLRDRLSLALALVLPLVLLFLFGFAISFSVTGLKVVVQDLDQSPLSRKYIEICRASLTFKVDALPVNMQPQKVLEAGTARAAIIIPEHFERDLVRGESAEVQWLVDATDANTANIMRGNAVALSQMFSAQLHPPTTVPAIRAETRLWFNPGRSSLQYIGPGVFAVVLALFPPLLAALAMSREGEQKTILQVYVSSISAAEFLLGKILAFFVVGACEWVLAMIMVYTVFGLRLVGDPTPFFVGSVCYLICNVSFGVMIGAAIPNQAAAIQAVALVSFLLSFLLSGFIFPISNVPGSIRWLSNIVPARYFIEITRDAFVRGGGWPGVWYAPLVLALLGLFFFFVAWRRMRHMQIEAS
jgi:drug efflux transport system permease protein